MIAAGKRNGATMKNGKRAAGLTSILASILFVASSPSQAVHHIQLRPNILD